MSQAPTRRTEVRRLPERGAYDRDLIESIIDEALICHVGFVHEGAPVVIPTIHARVDDTLYFHGSPASRMLRGMRSGEEICVTITLLDGLVVARAAFHNSMNYRSVVMFGVPRIVDDPAEKAMALEAVTEHVIPGRWADSRPMTDKEIKGTLVAALPISEVSAKLRSGGPKDDETDYDLPIWAGVVPLTMTPGEPVQDAELRVDVAVPAYVAGYRRPASEV
jgi:nitroimidazol reductase NimA-like FMN-containing flavoprotein (pyridoxamine 5'-phosphate oxidase superfamily)